MSTTETDLSMVDVTSTVELALAGNEFSALSLLQSAQLHLIKSTGDGTLSVSLDGDYAAILKLQSAVGDLLREVMEKYYLIGLGDRS